MGDWEDVAPVRSVNGQTGAVEIDTGGALFDESASVETVNQFWRLFDGKEPFFGDVMNDPAQADAVASNSEAMRVVFWFDL